MTGVVGVVGGVTTGADEGATTAVGALEGTAATVVVGALVGDTTGTVPVVQGTLA